MKIAIVGGGFTGLTAAYELTKSGHKVTLFEKDKELGGLANGFKSKSWDWPLEKAYHHWFTGDRAILDLIKELGLSDKIIIKRPITANFWHGRAYQFDSVKDFLRYPGLSTVDKFRTALLLVFLKGNPFWQPLESLTSENLIKAIGGAHAWHELWEPLMKAKFGDLSSKVAASWFWARIKKRTPSLGYFAGGFQTLVDKLSSEIENSGGKIYVNTSISSIGLESRSTNHELGKKYQIHNSKLKIHNSSFDAVLLTVPTPIAQKLLASSSSLPLFHSSTIPHLHAQTLILETKEPILKEAGPERSRRVYWLNILDRNFPFLAVVAHTNFMDKKFYGGHHLTYFGNYLPAGHPYLSMTKEELLQTFVPFIRRINPSFNYQLSTINYKLFTAPFAQPVHLLHYSKLAPKLETGVKGVYLANLDSVYPWDRGTNYAVELGQKAAKQIITDRSQS